MIDAHCPEDVGDKIRELEICVANAQVILNDRQSIGLSVVFLGVSQ